MEFSGSIKTTPEEIRALSAQLQDVADEMLYNFKELNGVFSRLNSSWDGDAMQSFYNNMLQYESDRFVRFYSQIIEFAKALETMSEVHKAVNSELISEISKIKF